MCEKIFTVPAYQDIVMIYDLFSNVVDAANALHVDKEFSKNITIAKINFILLKRENTVNCKNGLPMSIILGIIIAILPICMECTREI